MLQLMKDLPAHVLGVRAVGKVTKDDYEQTLVPALERAVRENGEINFLMLFETEVGNFTYGAWMEDAKLSLKHFSKWNKVAIVSDQTMIEKASNLLSFVSPAETKGFTVADIEIAKAWVAAPKEATEKK